MATLKARLEALEGQMAREMPSDRRTYFLIGGAADEPDGTCRAFVEAAGYLCGDSDLIVRVGPLTGDGEAEQPAAALVPLQFLHGANYPDEWRAAA